MGSPSFRAQRGHGIDASRPPRGQVAGESRHGGHEQADGHERGKVGGTDSVEQPANRASEAQGQRAAQGDAGQRQAETPAQDESRQIGTPRARRTPISRMRRLTEYATTP